MFPNKELLNRYINSDNIAEELDKDQLYKIASSLIEDITADDQTRCEWFENYNGALEMVKQVAKVKDHPWPNSANIMIPIILEACVQTNARLFPEIVQQNKTVTAQIIGKDSIKKDEIAQRISDHMTLQTIKIIPNWLKDTDKLLLLFSLTGTIFRKYSYDPIERKPTADLCLPSDIIVNNNISALEKAERITHVMYMSKNDILEKIRFGIYSDLTEELDVKTGEETRYNANNDSDMDSSTDPTNKPIELPSDKKDSGDLKIVWEVHCYLDLDEDGYKEPYIVTLLTDKTKILRIVANYDKNSFIIKNGQIIKIKAKDYFVAHDFLPSPEGQFLGMGFGQLLYHLSNTINTINNNLINSATLSNMRCGLIAKSLRLPKGDYRFTLGEFKSVDLDPGENLNNLIYTLPINEPSQTLMSLLQELTEFAKQIANISDIMHGNPVGANMPATTVVTMVEQGTKVYSAILMRLYESFKKEYQILYRINRENFNNYSDEDLYIKSGIIKRSDYEQEYVDILPIANPAIGNDAVKLAKVQALLQFSQQPEFVQLLNPREIAFRYLDALSMPNIDDILVTKDEFEQQKKQAAQTPTPEQIAAQVDAQLKGAQSQLCNMQASQIMAQHEIDGLRLELEEKKLMADAAFKGGQLATAKINSIIGLTQLEAVASPGAIAKAAQFTEKEVAISTPQMAPTVTAQIMQEQQAQQQGQGQQQNMLQDQNSSGNIPGNVPGQPAQEQNASRQTPGEINLPPELDAALQQTAQEQQIEKQMGTAQKAPIQAPEA